MEQLDRFNTLCETGRIVWQPAARGWLAEPDTVVAALAADGFHEYKRELLKFGGRRAPTGGIWQGLDERTGAVASALWIARDEEREIIVFVEINGTPLHGGHGG